MKVVLCDTNILFGFIKGDSKIRNSLIKIGNSNIAFPVIAHCEAYAGSSKSNFVKIKGTLSNYKVFHITEGSSKIFNGLIQSYHHRNSKWIPDALIAAIALSNNLELYTLNRKDFDFIPK